MAIARPDLAQVFARHAVQTVNSRAVVARFFEQLVERRPVIPPIQIKANALAQFLLVNFAAQPLVNDVLVAGEDGFDAQNYRTIAHERTLLDQRCGVTLRSGQRVIVADKNDVGRVQRVLYLRGIEQGIVTAKSLVKLAKIFATAMRILGADLALHSCQGMQLGCAAAGSEIRGRCHNQP